MTERSDPDPDSLLLDPQLLEFARRFDPARHLPDTPSLSAEQIRRSAEQRRGADREWRANPMARPARQIWLPAVCVAAILVLTGLGVTLLRPQQSPGPDLGLPASGSATSSRPSGPARPALLDLPAEQGNAKEAGTNFAHSVAKQKPRNPEMFTYIRRQEWSGGKTPPPTVVATDIRTWLRTDLSGFEQTTTLPAQPGGTQTAKWTQPQLPAGIQPTEKTFDAGGYPHPIPAPALQAGPLAVQISAAYSYHVAAGVADLFRLGLNPVQCEAALQVLASSSNIAYHGTIKDRASRTGIAFTSTDPGSGVREVLIFHPDTGELLDYEKWVTGTNGEYFVDAYILMLDIHTTDSYP